MKIKALFFTLEILFWPVFLGLIFLVAGSKLSISHNSEHIGLLLGIALGVMISIQKLRVKK